MSTSSLSVRILKGQDVVTPNVAFGLIMKRRTVKIQEALKLTRPVSDNELKSRLITVLAGYAASGLMYFVFHEPEIAAMVLEYSAAFAFLSTLRAIFGRRKEEA